MPNKFNVPLKNLLHPFKKERKDSFGDSSCQLESFLANSPDIVARYDTNLRHIFISSAIENLAGIPANQFPGKTISELKLPSCVCNLWEGALKKVILTSQPETVEFRFSTKEGLKYFQSQIVPEMNGGELRSILNITRDVTELRGVEDNLLSERNRLTNILSALEDGIYIITSNYDIEYVNSVLKKDFSQARGEKCYRALAQRNKKCPWCKGKEVFAGKTVHWQWFSQKHNKTYSIIEKPLLGPRGALSKIAILRDISREKEMDRVKTELVSLASHQLRSPLACISLSNEMLFSDSGNLSKEQKNYIRNINYGVKEMTSTVENLLNLSQIETGSIAAEPQPLSLRNITEKLLKERSVHIKKKGLIVKRYYDRSLPLINLDHKLTYLALDNLISNAIKYTPNQGIVLIEIKKKDKNALIKISDNGYGISKDRQLDLFKRVSSNNNSRPGLGLYIVKTAVTKLGAAVWFTSGANKGTTFYISIPLKGMSMKKTGSLI